MSMAHKCTRGSLRTHPSYVDCPGLVRVCPDYSNNNTDTDQGVCVSLIYMQGILN